MSENKCLVEKTNSGIAITIIVVVLFASFAGIGGFYLQGYVKKQHETRLKINIGDFYVRIHDEHDTFDQGYSYELGGLMIISMAIDKNLWNEMLKYDNITDFEIETNSTLKALIGTYIMFEYQLWGDTNGFIDEFSSTPISDDAKEGIDNKSTTLIWKNDYVVLLAGVMPYIYNHTVNGTKIINFDGFDIVGSQFTNNELNNLDFVNMTKILDPVAYHPSKEYTLTILGMDYDIDKGDATYLECIYNGKTIVVTDRDPLLF